MTTQKALIYCRINQSGQERKLASQESRCRAFARANGYEVVGVFSDVASGNAADRPGLNEMLGEIETAKRRGESPRIVIIEEISRLARRVDIHFETRAAINDAGGILVSPSFDFGNDPEKALMETLLINLRQFEAELQKPTERTLPRLRNWAGRILGVLGSEAA